MGPYVVADGVYVAGSAEAVCCCASLLLLQHLLIPVVVGVHSAQVDSQIAKCVAKCGVLSRKLLWVEHRSMRRSSGFRAEVGHSSKLVEGEQALAQQPRMGRCTCG